MSKVFKVILGMSLLIVGQTDAAGGFARNAWRLWKEGHPSASVALGALTSGVVFKGIEYGTIKPEIQSHLAQGKAEEAKRTIAQDMETFKIKAICKENGVDLDTVIFDPNSVHTAAIASFDNTNILFIKDQKMFKEEKEKRFVFGHECAHARNKHIKKKFLYFSSIPFWVSCFGAICLKFKPQVALPLYIGGIALLIGNSKKLYYTISQKHEFEADLHASKDPDILKAGATFLERFPSPKKNTTHPSNSKRAFVLRAHAFHILAEQEENK
jgi:hypothetical protein